MIECPGCGSNLRYNISANKMSCDACGTKYSVEEVERQRGGELSNNMDINVFICSQCAAEIYSADDAATAFCSYCGATHALTTRMKNERKPDYVAPFSITKEWCKDLYIKMMKKAIYAPTKLKSRKHIQEFRGIYMPYWVCDAKHSGPVNLYAKEERQSGSYTIENIYNLTTDVESCYRDVTVDASSMFADNISDRIGPFFTDEMRPFATGYLSGFYADLPDVDYTVYEKDILDVAAKRNLAEIQHEHPKMTIGVNKRLDNTFDVKLRNMRTALFPVWFMSYKNGDRIAYATVNGQTGKVVADIPMDSKKFLFGCALGAVPIFLLLNLFLTLRPTVLAFLAALIALIVSFVHLAEMKKIEKLDSHVDDKGLAQRHSLNRRLEAEQRARDEKNADAERFGGLKLADDMDPYVVKSQVPPVPKKSGGPIINPPKTSDIVWLVIIGIIVISVFVCQTGIFENNNIKLVSMLFVPIAGIVSCFNVSSAIKHVKQVRKKSGMGGIWITITLFITAAIEIMRPAADRPYYIACVLLGAGIVMTLLDIVFSYNHLVTRPLPQFDYKGGDDRA